MATPLSTVEAAEVCHERAREFIESAQEMLRQDDLSAARVAADNAATLHRAITLLVEPLQ